MNTSTKVLIMMINILAVSSLIFMINDCAIRSDAAIGCDVVMRKAKPCLGYAKGKGDENVVPPKCCDGMKTLSDKAKTAQDKQDVCNCLKQAFEAPGMALNDNRLNKIPDNCKLEVPFKLSKNLQCANIK